MSLQVLWELMELEAVEKCYIYREDEQCYAELPAMLIASGPFVAPDAKRNEFYTLWFGQGMKHYNSRTLVKAERKMKEILSTAKRSIQIKVEHRNGRIELLKVEAS